MDKNAEQIGSNIEKDFHKGHRSRLREKYIRGGADGLETHELMELLLFYCIPRRNTNETAHAILNRFGSLEELFSADIRELQQIDYISENGAVLIKLIGELGRRRMMESTSSIYRYDTLDKVGAFLVSLFSGQSVEKLYLLSFDNGMKLLNCSCICEGSVNSVNMCARKIIENIVHSGASNVVLAHNHPGGIAVPSKNDISLTHSLESLTSILGVKLLCHMVVSGDRYAPITPCAGKFELTL